MSMNKLLLFSCFVSLSVAFVYNEHHFDSCWYTDGTEVGDHCFGHGASFDWAATPPTTVVSKQEVELFLSLSINTTIIPLVGCGEQDSSDDQGDIDHSDHHHRKSTGGLGVLVSPIMTTCLSQSGYCSPFTSVVEHELDLCQEVPAGGCQIPEPLEIAGLRPLFVSATTAAALSPLSTAETHNYGDDLNLYHPSGWATLSTHEQEMLLANATKMTSIDCNAPACAEVAVYSPTDHLTHITNEVELVRDHGSDLATVDLSLSFTLYTPETSHTLLPFVQLTTCGGSAGNATFFVSVEHYGVVVTAPPKMLMVSSEVQVAMIVVQVLGAMILFVLLAILIYFRNHHVIRDAQGEVLVLIVFVGLGALLATTAHDPTRLGCPVKEWTFGPIPAFMLCLLCARVWRIDAIHRASQQSKRRTIKYWSNRLIHKYNEGKIIAFAIQNAVIMLLITAPVIVIHDGEEPSTDFFLSTTATTCTVVVLCCSLICPKIRFLAEPMEENMGEEVSSFQAGGEMIPLAKQIIRFIVPLTQLGETVKPTDLAQLHIAMRQLSRMLTGQMKSRKSSKTPSIFVPSQGTLPENV